MAVEKISHPPVCEVIDRSGQGIVIDAWVRVSWLALSSAIEAHIVVAGVDTYLKYAGP